MGIAERKDRQRADREQRITTVARHIAESEGWNAVTIRRLADEIEHSQPVLYAHFENRDAIVAAVAVDGFREITTLLRQTAHDSTGHRDALEKVAMAYLAFARKHPALYEAMFTMPTRLHFTEAEKESELADAYEALAAVVGPTNTDVAVATETFWAALHGFAELEHSGRIRNSTRVERVALVVDGLLKS